MPPTLRDLALAAALTAAAAPTQTVAERLPWPEGLTAWIAASPEARASIAMPAMPSGMDRAQADAWMAALFAALRGHRASLPGLEASLPQPIAEQIEKARTGDAPLALEAKTLGAGGHEMPYALIHRAQDQDAGERALFICTHGGGQSASAEGPHSWKVNSREFQTQAQFAIGLYEPDGVYFVPRMADDRLGRWWHRHNQIAWDGVIDHAILHWGVDPDRVYFLGISEGGYGTDILAPWMADRFAGANAMAAGVATGGNPPANLRNLAFRTDVGENDTMFERRPMAVRYHEALDALHAADPAGYRHSIEVQPGRGHGIDYRPGVRWIAAHRRDPWPERVVWHSLPLHGHRRARFYWLALPDAPDTGRFELDARVDRETNTITVRADVVVHENNDANMTHSTAESGARRPLTGQRLRLLLSDALLDLDRPVTVVCNGEQVYSDKVERSAAVMLEALTARPDPAATPSARIDVAL